MKKIVIQFHNSSVKNNYFNLGGNSVDKRITIKTFRHKFINKGSFYKYILALQVIVWECSKRNPIHTIPSILMKLGHH